MTHSSEVLPNDVGHTRSHTETEALQVTQKGNWQNIWKFYKMGLLILKGGELVFQSRTGGIIIQINYFIWRAPTAEF